MGATEIKGSRETVTEGKIATAVQLYVSTSAGDAIAAGAEYAGGAVGVLGKKCVRCKVTPEIIPAIFLITAQYQGFIAYA